MNISGIRPAVGFYNENSIRFRPDFNQKPVEEEIIPKLPSEDNNKSKVISDEEIASARQGQTFGSYDFASQYKPSTVHEMKGADSDIKSLDVEKAVDEMKKDSAIHRYQYFVQNKPKAGLESTDVRGPENFTL